MLINNFTFTSFIIYKFIINFFILIIILKLRIFFFHNWIIYCYEKSSWEQIFYLSTIIKFIPISFFCHFTNFWNNLIILLILNRIFISIYVNFNFSFKKIFACSTLFNNFLIIYIYLLNLKQFFLFILIYSIIFYYLIYLIKNNSRKLFIIFIYKIINYLFKLWILIYLLLCSLVLY